MFLDASGFHAGSFAPALSSRKVHPVYRLQYFEDGANDTFSISDLTSIFVEPFTVIVACLYLYFNFECLCWFVQFDFYLCHGLMGIRFRLEGVFSADAEVIA